MTAIVRSKRLYMTLPDTAAASILSINIQELKGALQAQQPLCFAPAGVLPSFLLLKILISILAP